ncbi:hypothetical protein ABT390_34275 [Streptomyces aurantiacus]|uniref:Uncharacterized protein n=1 Tax=Streptomyces aurantiacus JA 4570 TaxID=1286094 RepID=S3ZCQ4_9ACTN|nr:hypothetical protein [Streptomyces aurantiacus]EPH41476.1 hypothetical protein STRAU_5480 [Streptomyces aurantiacus JA 4570]
MYDIDQLSNAAAQLTGESLERARQRLAQLQRFDRLIPAASAEQELLESVLASALGAAQGQDRPFGVREASPRDEGLALRVDRLENVQALLELLPYRTKRGPWRGVRGLVVQSDGARLRFGLRTWQYEQSWRSSPPAVWVAGPHGGDLDGLLSAHERRVNRAGHSAHWDPQQPEPGPKKREPATRSLTRQLEASRGMGSALLRRPRLWDSLAGYAGLQASTRMTDYGLDWVVERQVLGPQFDCTRLVDILTDPIVGFGLRVLDHDLCGSSECTLRMAPRPGVWGWRGVLTVHSRQVPSGPLTAVPGPRPLTAAGDRLNVSRPQTLAADPPRELPGRRGAVVQLTGVPRSGGVRSDDLSWVAEQIAAVWAAQGLAAAVVLYRDRGSRWQFPRDSGRPAWATAAVPDTVAGWRRLRIAPLGGELSLLEVDHDTEAIAAALSAARRSFDRIVLVGRNDDWPTEEAAIGRLTDARLLVHRAASYERHISLPAETGEDSGVVMLTPPESAVQWRQQELGGWTPKYRLTGLLFLTGAQQPPAPDEFDLAVEEQLARHGTPVVGRFPANGWIIRGPGHSSHPPTVLDPESEHPTHDQMITAVDALAQRLWPHRVAELGTSPLAASAEAAPQLGS